MLNRLSPTSSRTIAEVCGLKPPNMNFDYCVKALGSDPRSQTADVRGLGLIAFNLLESSVTSTGSYVQQLLKQKWEPYVQKCLSDCSDLYSDSVESTKGAVGAYQALLYPGVQFSATTVSTDADKCEGQFKEKQGATLPLTKRNGDVTQQFYIELAILAIVRGS
ncbi:putative invertase inhibitor [Rhodamnia argentea]|uniref:Invertase inhibitor n=1 Tax=Rhodamnia argentea TaxID=178133 RepID=A0A8B8N9V4_9MYRT|nr:putative invertase inhibitor [Rhodamnia argentea]